MKAKGIIIGGGIGGLACGIALHRAGWEVKVLEQAEKFGEVGAGISLWPNSLRALDMLGVGEKVRQNGAWLFRSNIEAIEKAYGQTILIHRADLIDALVDALPHHVLTLSAKVTDIQPGDNGVQVKHAIGIDIS